MDSYSNILERFREAGDGKTFAGGTTGKVVEVVHKLKNPGFSFTDGDGNSIMIGNIDACPRCGEDHDLIWTKKLKNPISISEDLVFTYWCLCPTTQEPIILQTKKVELVNDFTLAT